MQRSGEERGGSLFLLKKQKENRGEGVCLVCSLIGENTLGCSDVNLKLLPPRLRRLPGNNLAAGPTRRLRCIAAGEDKPTLSLTINASTRPVLG